MKFFMIIDFDHIDSESDVQSKIKQISLKTSSQSRPMVFVDFDNISQCFMDILDRSFSILGL